jgi:hypothetical protein
VRDESCIGLVSGVLDSFRVSKKIEERRILAEGFLGRELSKREGVAVYSAHVVGHGELGKDGSNLARIGNYTEQQIADKARILSNAGFSIEERRVLMETGVTGTPKPLVTYGPFNLSDVEKSIKSGFKTLKNENGSRGEIPNSMKAEFRSKYSDYEPITGHKSLSLNQDLKRIYSVNDQYNIEHHTLGSKKGEAKELAGKIYELRGKRLALLVRKETGELEVVTGEVEPLIGKATYYELGYRYPTNEGAPYINRYIVTSETGVHEIPYENVIMMTSRDLNDQALLFKREFFSTGMEHFYGGQYLGQRHTVTINTKFEQLIEEILMEFHGDRKYEPFRAIKMTTEDLRTLSGTERAFLIKQGDHVSKIVIGLVETVEKKIQTGDVDVPELSIVTHFNLRMSDGTTKKIVNTDVLEVSSDLRDRTDLFKKDFEDFEPKSEFREFAMGNDYSQYIQSAGKEIFREVRIKNLKGYTEDILRLSGTNQALLIRDESGYQRFVIGEVEPLLETIKLGEDEISIITRYKVKNQKGIIVVSSVNVLAITQAGVPR